jgi:hypothetical protein
VPLASRRKALVVDDNPDQLRGHAAPAQGAGHLRPIRRPTAFAGFSTWRRRRYDIVFADVTCR